MGNALGGETTVIGDELLLLKHTINVPARLLLVDASFLTPWFSNERLSREDLHWRILLGTRFSNTRHVSVQAAMSEQRIPAQPQETELIIESIAVHFKWGSCAPTLAYKGKKDFLMTGTWIDVGELAESAETRIRATDSNFSIFVHIQLLKTAQRVAMDQPPAALIWPPQKQGEHGKKVLNHMLEGGAYSDVTLKLGKVELKAHRCVLSANSPVFEAMFKHNFIEKQLGEVSIEDIQPEVMRVALQHMYGANMKGLDSEMSMKLLHVADKYQISSLRCTCEAYLLGDGSVDVLKVLISAYDNNATQLKDIILKRILKNPSLIKVETLEGVAFTHPRAVADVLKALAQK